MKRPEFSATVRAVGWRTARRGNTEGTETLREHREDEAGGKCGKSGVFGISPSAIKPVKSGCTPEVGSSFWLLDLSLCCGAIFMSGWLDVGGKGERNEFGARFCCGEIETRGGLRSLRSSLLLFGLSVRISGTNIR